MVPILPAEALPNKRLSVHISPNTSKRSHDRADPARRQRPDKFVEDSNDIPMFKTRGIVPVTENRRRDRMNALIL